jgi:hypothetical protein
MDKATQQERLDRLKAEREKVMCLIEAYPQTAWQVIAELNSLIFELEGQTKTKKTKATRYGTQ